MERDAMLSNDAERPGWIIMSGKETLRNPEGGILSEEKGHSDSRAIG
jgi:hypothetical protein